MTMDFKTIRVDEVYHNVVKGIVNGAEKLRKDEQRRALHVSVLCKDLNRFRLMAEKLEQNADTKTIRESFQECSEKVRNIVLALYVTIDQMKILNEKCKKWIEKNSEIFKEVEEK